METKNKKKVGRPKKQVEVVYKRGRGRPKKSPLDVLDAVPQSAAPKKRGRPPKVASEGDKAPKKKRGRPRKALLALKEVRQVVRPRVLKEEPKEAISLSTGASLPTQLSMVAVTQIDLTNKINNLSNGFTNMARNLEEIIVQVNKANQELAKRIQVLESQYSELDRLICDHQKKFTESKDSDEDSVN